MGGCFSTRGFLRVARGVGVADCVGAGAGRFFGMSRGAGVGDSAEAGAGRLLGAKLGAAVEDPVGAGAGRFFGMRRGAGVGDHVGAEAAVGGARGCLQLRLPGTGGGIITGTGNGLAMAGSRTGVASGLAPRAAGLCLSVADSVLALADP